KFGVQRILPADFLTAIRGHPSHDRRHRACRTVVGIIVSDIFTNEAMQFIVLDLIWVRIITTAVTPQFFSSEISNLPRTCYAPFRSHKGLSDRIPTTLDVATLA